MLTKEEIKELKTGLIYLEYTFGRIKTLLNEIYEDDSPKKTETRSEDSERNIRILVQ